MKRRTFLGGILGLIAGTQIKIPAEESKARLPATWLERAKRALHCFELTEEQLLQYRIDLVTGDGHAYKGMLVKSVEVKGKNGNELLFKASSIEFLQTMDIQGFNLIGPDGNLVHSNVITHQVPVNRGDVLKLNFTLSWEGNV